MLRSDTQCNDGRRQVAFANQHELSALEVEQSTYLVAVGFPGFAEPSDLLIPFAIDCSRNERFDLDEVALVARYLEKLSFVCDRLPNMIAKLS